MSLKPEDMGRSDIGDLLSSPLSDLHAKALQDWAARFEETYDMVGTLCRTASEEEPPACTVAAPAAVTAAARVLTPLRAPGVPELVCMKPRIYRVRGFLTAPECNALRQMVTGAEGMLFSEAKIREGLRASDCRWTEAERQLLSGIERRLGWLLGTSPHEDEVELVGTLTPPCGPSAPRCHLGLHVDTNGGRTWRYATAICYLSSVPGGGCTVFPLARPAEEEDRGPPSPEETELLEASQRLLDADVDHTDRVLAQGQRPERRGDAEALVAAASAGCGVSLAAEEGTVALFWTRRCDGSIDPHAWHGGEAVGGGCAKWTLQKFKEVPLEARAGPDKLAAFVARSRRLIMS